MKGKRGNQRTVDLSSYSIIKPRSKRDDNISTLHRQVGIRTPVHSEHVQTPLIQLVERSQSLQRSRDRNIPILTQQLQQLWSFLSREHSLSRVDDGSFGIRDEGRSSSEGGLGDMRSGHGGGGRGGPRPRGKRRSSVLGVSPSFRDRLTENSSGHVLGKIDEDGSGAPGSRNLEGLIDPARELRDVLDHDVPLCARARDTNNVGLLESIRSDCGGGDLPAEDDEGSSIREGVLHRRDDVGRSRSRSDEHDSRLP